MAVALGAGVVKSQGVVPTKAQGRAIVGMHISLAFTMTQSGKASWTPDLLFGGLKITKGSNTQIEVLSYAQLQRLFNMITGLTDTQTVYFNDPSSAGNAGTSSSSLDIFLPLNFKTDTPVQTVFSFNGYGSITNGTAGSVNITIDYYYANIDVKDDDIKIVTTPTALSSGVDVDVSQYFSVKSTIAEVYVDIGVADDTKLSDQRFEVGGSTVFDHTQAFELRAKTTLVPWMAGYAGFFKCQTKPAIYPASGTVTQKPKLILNLGGSYSPTFYLFLA